MDESEFVLVGKLTIKEISKMKKLGSLLRTMSLKADV